MRCLRILLALAACAGAAFSPAAAQGAAAGLSVKITQPSHGEYIFGKTKIAARVESRHPIEGLRVEFSVAGRLIFIDREAPWECFHDFGDESRSWVVEARAIAPDGTTAEHTIVTKRLEIHYREEVDRVLVTLSVKDRDGSFIEGLGPEDFTVFEDGVQQKILEFELETRPITLGVLIDTSGSMKEEIKEVQAAAQGFFTNLRPEDRAFVVDFDETVVLLEDFTNDHETLQASVEGTDAEGGTAIYDAVYVSYRKMRHIEGRKALAVLTDGEDTHSTFSFNRVMELTRTHDVLVYSIGLGATVLDRAMRSTLKKLAEDSGGRAFFPQDAKELTRVYDDIASDLRSQYYLTYSSINREFDGSWRKIEVKTSVEGANVRTRRGYYAVKR